MLAALMSDGPLPATMRPPPDDPVPPTPPPRFCDFGGGDQDGGVGMPGPRPPIGIPIAAPGTMVPGPIGTAGSGSGTAGGSAEGDAGVADGGVGMGGSGGFPGEEEGSCESVPIGFWRFDDCNPFRSDLQDFSGENHTAFRNVDLTCTPSQEGLGVTFSRTDDLVYVPDQPAFALDEGVTVAAWVNPDRVDRTQTIFRKRDDGTSSIALVINNRQFRFIIRFSDGRLVNVSAPAEARKWTHVAATYDGAYLRLYKDGSEVSSTQAEGTIARGVGPLLMGNDMNERRLLGSMDNAWFNTLAAPPETIFELTCLQQAPTVEVEPLVGPAVPGGTTVTYTLSLTNNNSASCTPRQFIALAQVPEGFTSEPFFAFTLPIPSGERGDMAFDVTSNEETEPGTYDLSFLVFREFFDFGSTIDVHAQYVVVEPTGCFVRTSRVLTIRDVSVVDDPLRTTMDGPAEDTRTGAWSFGRLMERLAPTPEAAPDVTEAMFTSFITPQLINGFTAEERSLMKPVVLDPWPRTADGKLDLARAPMRLLAIVNRLDLKDLAQGKAGEGRLVYGVLDENGFPMEFTVIFEYLLAASNEAEFQEWAEAFHALQTLPFPSEEYNAALQAITDRFTGRNAAPSMPNGSALIDVRTNEIALSFQWQLREFRISPTTGLLDPAPLFQTPDSSFNFSERLGRFINENEAIILTERHEVPLSFEGEPFQTGAVFNNIDFWDAPGINNPEARHKFSLNTCNGCHGAETNTGFLQIFPRFPGEQSGLASFQTGTTVFDPVTGESRRLAELARRRALLEAVVCADEEEP